MTQVKSLLYYSIDFSIGLHIALKGNLITWKSYEFASWTLVWGFNVDAYIIFGNNPDKLSKYYISKKLWIASDNIQSQGTHMHFLNLIRTIVGSRVCNISNVNLFCFV
jgi:hypothetical protein